MLAKHDYQTNKETKPQNKRNHNKKLKLENV